MWSTLGTNYTLIGSTSPVIATNRAQAGSPSFGQSAAYIARHNTVLTQDTQEIVFVPITPTAGFANVGGGAFLRCTTGGVFIAAYVTNTNASIFTYSAGSSTTRATSGTIATPTSVRFTAVGNLYSIYVNGSATAAVTWTDTGGVIAIGTTTRSFGVFFNAQNSGSVTRGWAIDSITARDGVSA